MIRETTLCLVLAHTAVAATVERHRPLWNHAAQQIILVTPVDAVLPRDGCYHLTRGWNSKYGVQNNLRVRDALRLASQLGFAHVILTEYDAVIWGPIPPAAIPPAGGLSAARFTEPAEWGGITFKGTQYFHFPIIFDRAALAPIVAAMDALPADAEGGYADRYIGLAAERAGLPYKDLFAHGLAFSRDTIEGRKIELCRRAVAAGARFSHGIKSAEAFNRIMEVAPWK